MPALAVANRIPSCLKWLIDNRARLAGELEKTARAAREAKRLIRELDASRKSLAAIVESLKLHEIRIEVNCIKSVRTVYKTQQPSTRRARLLSAKSRAYHA